MKNILVSILTCIVLFLALVVVHEYGQRRYMQGLYDATHLEKYLYIEGELYKARSGRFVLDTFGIASDTSMSMSMSAALTKKKRGKK